jgi:hypothetical protein
MRYLAWGFAPLFYKTQGQGRSTYSANNLHFSRNRPCENLAFGQNSQRFGSALVFAGLGLGKNLNADPDPDPDHKKM